MVLVIARTTWLFVSLINLRDISQSTDRLRTRTFRAGPYCQENTFFWNQTCSKCKLCESFSIVACKSIATYQFNVMSMQMLDGGMQVRNNQQSEKAMHINRELERLAAMTRNTENDLRKLQSKQEYFVINYQDSLKISCLFHFLSFSIVH